MSETHREGGRKGSASEREGNDVNGFGLVCLIEMWKEQEGKLMLGGEEKQQRNKESRRARNKNPPLFAHKDALVDGTR